MVNKEYKNKTKKQLLEELKQLSGDHENIKKQLNQWTHELKERSKELNCLYNIFNIIDKEYSTDKIIQKITSIIPFSWQYPEITCARIIWEDKEFKTENFKESLYSQSSDIVVYGEKKGTVEIFYLEKKEDSDEGPFLRAERYLINGIGQTLGKIIELKKAEIELKNSHTKLHNLLERLEIVREEERKNIAEEIYEEVGHLLDSLKLDIKDLSKSLPANEKMLINKINSMLTLVDVTIQNVKRVVSELSPLLVEEFGLSVAILWYIKELESRMGIKCKINFNPRDVMLDREQSRVVYQLIQELLTNIIFHTMATKINITLEKIENNLALYIKDNGVGLKHERNHNQNNTLWGIKERIDYLGGRFIINSQSSYGNTTNIFLPLNNNKNHTIKLLIADDHPLILRGLRQILGETDDIKVIDEATSGSEIIKKVIKQKNLYDLILMNIAMPDMSGLTVIKTLKTRNTDLPVLSFGNYSENLYAIKALQAGSSGYLTKEHLIGELILAIRLSVQGKKYIPQSIADLLANNIGKNFNNKLPHELLSEREFEIMCMMSSNKKLKNIAEELSLSLKTVSSHKANILKKMNLKNTSEIIKYVIDTGIKNNN